MPDIMINGPDGRLEGRYRSAEKPDAPIALILHPHPQHGGTMNNKVVYTLYHAFLSCGYSTLRFNFRGVGLSQGTYDRGEGELADAASALDWLQAQNPNASHCCVAGFSFGAWIGMQLLMRRPEIDSFVAVSPPANMFDFSFLAPCPSPGLILLGQEDELVVEQDVRALAGRLAKQKNLDIDYRIVPKANHFYNNAQGVLSRQVIDYLQKREEQRKAHVTSSD